MHDVCVSESRALTAHHVMFPVKTEKKSDLQHKCG